MSTLDLKSCVQTSLKGFKKWQEEEELADF
jgi:hypothetical protein